MPDYTLSDYHEHSKHHLNRYAAGPGGLDWANQPDPFRCYKGTARIELPLLEAEASGIRATGIGCFFDDEMLGLRGHAWQSLYNFTAGGPVDDARLTTLPAYTLGHSGHCPP
jgi:hypothetical protein